jgi:hypothetical protein
LAVKASWQNIKHALNCNEEELLVKEGRRMFKTILKDSHRQIAEVEVIAMPCQSWEREGQVWLMVHPVCK